VLGASPTRGAIASCGQRRAADGTARWRMRSMARRLSR
jgi:hypothetical protein